MDTEDQTNHITARFLSAMAHELWSPLASIKGSATSLIDLLQDLSPVEIDGFLQAIDADSDRLIAMLSDLIDLAQFQVGQLRLHVAPTHLADLIALVIDALRERDIDRAVTVDACDVVVQVDAARIRQVLDTLISASIVPAHSDKPMSINIALAESKQAVIGVREFRSVPLFEEALTILDQPSVLERFAEPSIRHQVPTMLRLTLSRILVELHGGTVWLDEQPDEYPAVYFSLPIATPSSDI